MYLGDKGLAVERAVFIAFRVEEPGQIGLRTYCNQHYGVVLGFRQ